MLKTGLKAGKLIDFRYLNIIAKTAEQIANVNITSRIKGLSDAGQTSTLNSIFHTQLRDTITLVSVYVSSSSLSSLVYPSINAASDENGISLIGSYNFIDNSLEEFDYEIDGTTYKVTFLKKSYSVAPAAINKRTKLDIYPMSSTIKDFTGTYLNSMFIMQIDSSLTGITLAEDDALSSYTYINKIKEAFRLNMSYNIIAIDSINEKQINTNLLSFISAINDLHEVLSLTGTEAAVVNMTDTIDPTTGQIIMFKMFYDGVVTNNTVLDYKIFAQNERNQKKLNYIGGNYQFRNALSLTTKDTLNLAINSNYQDALNSYELIKINEDFANRLQAKLYYPTIGDSLITDGDPGTPVDLNIVMNNNIDNLNFSRELTLINGYKLKFSINN